MKKEEIEDLSQQEKESIEEYTNLMKNCLNWKDEREELRNELTKLKQKVQSSPCKLKSEELKALSNPSLVNKWEILVKKWNGHFSEIDVPSKSVNELWNQYSKIKKETETN
jgi:hypothetical protein